MLSQELKIVTMPYSSGVNKRVNIGRVTKAIDFWSIPETANQKPALKGSESFLYFSKYDAIITIS